MLLHAVRDLRRELVHLQRLSFRCPCENFPFAQVGEIAAVAAVGPVRWRSSTAQPVAASQAARA